MANFLETAITDSQSAGTFGPGTVFTFTITFSGNVTVTKGTTLTLSDGGLATFVSSSGKTAIFTYTVGKTGSSQNTGDLAVTGIASGGFSGPGRSVLLNPPSSTTSWNPAGIQIIDTTATSETLPGTQTDPLSGGGKITFGASSNNQITVGGNAYASLTTKFVVTDGTLSVTGTATGITVTGNGSASLTITGTESAINSFINNNLTYTTTGLAGSTDTMTVTTTDSAGDPQSSGAITIDLTCFMPGTLIRTPTGDVVVESLQRGDLVLTADGRALTVSWLGRQTVSTIFGDKQRVLPIRIKAGALDENVPSRDLLVSPDHAILVDGALIHAGALVNGTLILRETNVPVIFTYYHIELDEHALVLAENAPAESFVDNVDRLGFDNWAEHEALHPEGKAIEEMRYPRAKAQRQVPVRTRVRLVERAQAIGALEAAVA